MNASVSSLAEVFDFRDPALDAPGLLARIETQLASRRELPPSPAQRHRAALRAERQALLAHLAALDERLGRYGQLGEARPGLAGRAALFLKRVIRKLVRRHLDEQREFNAEVLATLRRLTESLDARDASWQAMSREAAERT